MIHQYAARRDDLRQKIQELELDGYLVLHPANRFYLSGFELHDSQCNESAGCLLITAGGKDKLCTDPRYLDAARRVWPEEDIFVYKQDRLKMLLDFFKKSNMTRLGFESRSTSYETYKTLAEEIELEPSQGLTEELRKIKSQPEIDLLRDSCSLNHEVFSGIQGFVLSGVSESGLAWQAEKMFRENGASELAFAPIVAFGPNGALPHSIPGARVLEDNLPVLMDMGGRKKEYCSDQTRSFWNGEEPSDIFQRTLEQVQEAQRLAIEAIRPGMELKDLYRVAYDFFAGRGVEKHFTHGLGHGIGLETHEFPGIGPKSVGTLEAGMVITVEPGLYYPDWGGVRWEHMVLVTEDGAKVM